MTFSLSSEILDTLETSSTSFVVSVVLLYIQPWREFVTIINRHEDTQVYGTILPKELTNQAILDSNAYKTYYAFAFREKNSKKQSYGLKEADFLYITLCRKPVPSIRKAPE
ncbi:hypothetical protein Tco_0715066 [Tanacetum coccineum]